MSLQLSGVLAAQEVWNHDVCRIEPRYCVLDFLILFSASERIFSCPGSSHGAGSTCDKTPREIALVPSHVPPSRHPAGMHRVQRGSFQRPIHVKLHAPDDIDDGHVCADDS